MIEFSSFISVVIYLLVFFTSIIFCITFEKRESKLYSFTKKKEMSEIIRIIFIISLPVLISTFRYGVGTDYFAYVGLYEQYKSSEIIQVLFNETEPLFKVIYILVGHLFSDAIGLFFITSFLMLFILTKSLHLYKSILYIGFSLLIFYFKYYGTSLNIMRQMLAVVIVFYSYKFLLDRQRIRFILTVFCAGFVHSTALVVLPLVIFATKKTFVKKMNFSLLMLIILLTPFFTYIGVKLLINLNISKYFSVYSLDFSNSGIGFLIWIFPILIPILLFRRRLLDVNVRLDILIYIYILQIPFAYLGYSLVSANRLMLYFSIVEIILVSTILKLEKNIFWRRLFCLYFFIWYLFLFIYNFYIHGAAEIFPLILKW